MTAVGIGAGLNTFTPAFDPAATGSLQVEFTRNPKIFKLLQYIKLIPVNVMAGYYLRMDPLQGNRVVTPQDQIWPIGMDRPKGRTLDADYILYATQRYTESFSLPNEIAAQAKWDVKAFYARVAATLMMVGRTRRAWAKINDTTLYTSGTNLFANTNALVGSAVPWDAATDVGGIQQTIQSAIQKIQLNTASVAQASDICMIINPRTAKKMSASAEMRSFVKANEASLNFLQSMTPTWRTWNIPPNLYGLGNVVVEDASYTSTRKGASTQTSDYIAPDNVVTFAARPDGLIGAEGVPSFAGISCFAYEDMTVEIGDPQGEDAVKNRRTWGGVTDNSGFDLTAPAAMLRLTTCFT